MRVIAVTTFYPNSAEPRRTVFVENLMSAMQAHCDISVVAPIPWRPPIQRFARWYLQSQVAATETRRGIEVRHPRYLVVPKVDSLSGVTYCLAVLPVLRRLLRDRGQCVLHVHCAYPDAVGAAMAARWLGVPYVITAHGSDINVYAEHRTLRAQIRWALRGAAGVIAVSEALKDRIQRLTGGLASPLIKLPCAGYDGDHFYPRFDPGVRAELGLDESARTVLFVGNLVTIKGLDYLIDAWRRLTEQGGLRSGDRLLIIGKGPCRQELEDQVAAGGLAGTVQFLGEMSQASVSRWVAAATLLCLPSRNEGTPNVVVEALACGIPVVASRVGGLPELIKDGINGQLVPAGDVDALADALIRTMSRSWEKPAISATVGQLTWANLGRLNCEFLATAIAP